MAGGPVAVIGGGISGLAAAHALRHSHPVTLFEAQKRVGGNAHTVTAAAHANQPNAVDIDTGVTVLHEPSTPPLFDELDIAHVSPPADLTYLTIRCTRCGFDTSELENGLPRRPHVGDDTWSRLVDDYQRLGNLVASGSIALTSYELVATEGFSEYFVEHVVVPAIAGAFVMSPAAARRCSATAMLRALADVGLQLGDPLRDYYTVKGGTKTYIDRLAAAIPDLRVGTAIQAVSRGVDGVTLRDSTGATYEFDKAIIAVSADRALAMLTSPTALQREVLAAFPYDYTSWTLHTDPSVETSNSVLHYQMADCTNAAVHINLLHNPPQRIPGPIQYVSTSTHGGPPPDPASALETTVHGIAIITPEAVAAQQKLPQISDSTLAFAGAYFGDTGHENALYSGLKAASLLLGGSSSGGLRDMRTGTFHPWCDQP
ncbi:FAD-dependent oxidoreductase [Actinomadura terrae]|uniref:FAD-dependent oxidoreductase n=1 Tax=Actinomadura terrae TaxID=604353 RepID=UPI001FA81096|nr:FAD-dependent oxidoreductase [Actinomadura terrae]